MSILVEEKSYPYLQITEIAGTLHEIFINHIRHYKREPLPES